MNRSIYIRLAAANLKNNRRTYVPYILTAVLTVMMYYIMDALQRSDSVGDGATQTILELASRVMLLFSVIFLFYTNSFLIKRRKKEIGVYHILGMGKPHLAKMLTVETAVTALTSIFGGIAAGMLFGRLMFLLMLKVLHYDVSIRFEQPRESFIVTAVLFALIFLLTLLYNLWQIRLANPVELLRGSARGEREPKSRWLLTLVGVLAIGAGYFIAFTVKTPLNAVGLFFVAAACVVIGTYALFIGGSIIFLKLLRKNKRYYYKTKHFISVSGMIYRMKQNGAGLANICVLSTMVLVMISTTVSLCAGQEDILRSRFPQEVKVGTYLATPEEEQRIAEIVSEVSEEYGVKPEHVIDTHIAAFAALRGKDGFSLNSGGAVSYNDKELVELYMIPQDDYNRMEDDDLALGEDEVALYTTGKELYGKDVVRLNGEEYQVVRELETLKLEPKNASRIVPGYYLVVRDTAKMEQFLAAVRETSDMKEEWKQTTMQVQYEYAFDLSGDRETGKKAGEAVTARLAEELPDIVCESREGSRESFWTLYGMIFFIGVYLGAMFLMATVLIIYYKQISEGYDDRERYQIMRKVGMGRREVRSSIRSQVLTVFFLPLVVAVIHIAVAFRVISKLMVALNFNNKPLFAACTAATVGVFALFYVIVFMITTREYYRVVE